MPKKQKGDMAALSIRLIQDFCYTLAELGYELTPDEVRAALEEVMKRISHGQCRRCRKEAELRYGFCFDCTSGAGAEKVT